MTKTCLSCGNRLSGRIDKKFCSPSCKNDFHNTTQMKSSPVEKMVSAAIRRNRKILQNLFDEGLRKLKKAELEHYGFSFRGLTGIDETDRGELQLFCYEYAIFKKGKEFELSKWFSENG